MESLFPYAPGTSVRAVWRVVLRCPGCGAAVQTHHDFGCWNCTRLLKPGETGGRKVAWMVGTRAGFYG